MLDRRQKLESDRRRDEISAAYRGGTVTGLAARTARKGFGQSDKVRDFADFFRKGLASEFLAHFRFH
jgi:hypothetical protein